MRFAGGQQPHLVTGLLLVYYSFYIWFRDVHVHLLVGHQASRIGGQGFWTIPLATRISEMNDD